MSHPSYKMIFVKWGTFIQHLVSCIMILYSKNILSGSHITSSMFLNFNGKNKYILSLEQKILVFVLSRVEYLHNKPPALTARTARCKWNLQFVPAICLMNRFLLTVTYAASTWTTLPNKSPGNAIALQTSFCLMQLT